MNIAKKLAPLLSFNEKARLKCSGVCELSRLCDGLETEQLKALRLLEETPSGLEVTSLGLKVCLELDQKERVATDVILKAK